MQNDAAGGVREVDHVIDPHPGAAAHAGAADRGREVRLAGPRADHQHALSWLARKPPPASSRTSALLIGVSAKSKPAPLPWSESATECAADPSQRVRQKVIYLNGGEGREANSEQRQTYVLQYRRHLTALISPSRSRPRAICPRRSAPVIPDLLRRPLLENRLAYQGFRADIILGSDSEAWPAHPRDTTGDSEGTAPDVYVGSDFQAGLSADHHAARRDVADTAVSPKTTGVDSTWDNDRLAGRPRAVSPAHLNQNDLPMERTRVDQMKKRLPSTTFEELR